MHDVYIFWYDWRNHGSFHGWFSVYAKTFDDCLENLDNVLQRCEEKHLVLNWEKCHFNWEGIVLGHLVSEQEIEVDRAKIEVIE